MKRQGIADALRDAIAEEMNRDQTVFCLGEDIGVPGGWGGAFTVTLGLAEKFPGRIIDTPIAELVPQRARFALDCGVDGVVCSGQEVGSLRREVDHRLLTVCPGIRPVATADDQKRTVDVAAAFAAGADYIVMGRPIRQAANPRAAAEAVQAHIAQAFNVR